MLRANLSEDMMKIPGVKRDWRLKRYMLVVACTLLMVACNKAQPEAAEPVVDRAYDSRIWDGLVPPAKEHVALRLPEIDSLQPLQGGVLFIGDSITEGAPLYAMFPGVSLANYGIGWDTSDGVLLRLDQVRRNKADRAFILIGTNDVNYTQSPERIAKNILSIVAQLAADIPDTELYVISILPREAPNNAVVAAANVILESSAKDAGYIYLDLATPLMAEDGTLRADLTFDGLHLNVHGYSIWARALDACVRDGCSGVAQATE
jgi:lysophospholipase L1-like esterase